MVLRRFVAATTVASAVAAALTLAPANAREAGGGSDYGFATPVFGLDTDWDGSLLVADAGAGIVRLRHGHGRLVAELPDVTDVARTWFGLFATTGGEEEGVPLAPHQRKLYRVVGSHVFEFADIGAAEEAMNPDGGILLSNPFDVAPLWDGSALVADAAANALWIVDRHGNIDWVATLPKEVVSSAHIKQLLNCPSPPVPGGPGLCFLPPMLPAEAVLTSVAIGPDGAYYVGELKGIPAPLGESRVWRIRPGARHAQCGTSPDCTIVADGFTSIIDLNFHWTGELHVVELDESSWFALQLGQASGGTVNACRKRLFSNEWRCREVETGLLMPTAVTSDFFGRVWSTTRSLIPGMAEVVRIQ
jgi:hypothetical protein